MDSGWTGAVSRWGSGSPGLAPQTVGAAATLRDETPGGGLTGGAGRRNGTGCPPAAVVRVMAGPRPGRGQGPLLSQGQWQVWLVMTWVEIWPILQN